MKLHITENFVYDNFIKILLQFDSFKIHYVQI